MKFSLNIKSATSKVRQTVPIGVSSCPLGTIIWNFGAGHVSEIGSGGNSLILLRSCPDMALVRAQVSIKPSSVSFSKSIGK